MTPELIAALLDKMLDKLPELIIAVGVLVTSVASVMAARRGGKVLEVSNGHAAKLEAKIKKLQEDLTESLVDRLAERVLAKQAADDQRQAAADVQATLMAKPPKKGKR